MGFGDGRATDRVYAAGPASHSRASQERRAGERCNCWLAARPIQPGLLASLSLRRYDGYRLTYLGYDYLAIKALVNRGAIAGVGRQVGRGGRRA